jgi:hypothetical protein
VPSQPRAPCRPRRCVAPVEVEAAGVNPRDADYTAGWRSWGMDGSAVHTNNNPTLLSERIHYR